MIARLDIVAYPAKVWPEDGVWYVNFPRLGTSEGLNTYGETEEEALAMARECLTGYIESADSRGVLQQPDPGVPHDYLIRPELPIAAALTLRSLRKAAGLTKREASELLGLNLPFYSEQEETSGEGILKIQIAQRLSRILELRDSGLRGGPLNNHQGLRNSGNEKRSGYSGKPRYPQRLKAASAQSPRHALSEVRRRFRAAPPRN